MNMPPKNSTSVTRNTHIPNCDGVLLLLERVEVVLQRRVVLRAPPRRGGGPRQTT